MLIAKGQNEQDPKRAMQNWPLILQVLWPPSLLRHGKRGGQRRLSAKALNRSIFQKERFATFSPSPLQPTSRRLWRGYNDRAGRAARPPILAFHPIIGLQTVVQKTSNLSAATLSELFRPGSPMLSQFARLIKNRKRHSPAGKSIARRIAAPARIEIVPMEKKQHHLCCLDTFKQRIKSRRVQAPTVIVLREIAECRRGSRDNGIDLAALTRRHQGYESAEGLTSESHFAVTVLL